MEHEVKLERNEMSKPWQMCGFNSKDWKENTEIKNLLGLKPVRLSIKGTDCGV